MARNMSTTRKKVGFKVYGSHICLPTFGKFTASNEMGFFHIHKGKGLRHPCSQRALLVLHVAEKMALNDPFCSSQKTLRIACPHFLFHSFHHSALVCSLSTPFQLYCSGNLLGCMNTFCCSFQPLWTSLLHLSSINSYNLIRRHLFCFVPSTLPSSPLTVISYLTSLLQNVLLCKMF